MDTQNDSTPDNRPEDQQERAASAHLNPNDPAKDARQPNYGTFGHADETTENRADGRSGANDNPDEFSEFRDEKDANNAPDNLEDQPGHVMQNQNPGLVAAVQAQGGDTEELRKAWSIDDPRYAGGGTHNTREEPADANYPAEDKD